MSYYQYAETLRETTSAKTKKQKLPEEVPAQLCATYYSFLNYRMSEEGKHKLTSDSVFNTIDFFVYPEDNLKCSWQENVGEVSLSDNINIKPIFFCNKGHYVERLPIEDTRLLSQIDKALESFYKPIKTLTEGFFCSIRAISSNRAPGFVIEGYIIIADYDRDLEYKIYKELADLLRNNSDLLFNIHVIARKERELEKIIPENYTRYSIWSDYVC